MKNFEVNKTLNGDCLEILKTMPNEVINCCVTSPPYWGLRDYGTAVWEGGDKSCSHKRDNKTSGSCTTGQRNVDGAIGDGIYKTVCKVCGAVRIDRQVGLEETPDGYVAKMVEIFREVKRVLRNDGTLWLNLGDTYATEKTGFIGLNKKTELKQKDLVGIPWKVAFALQADGWYLRQDIIWHKPNQMPESVADRCTKSHEYIFLLTKSKQYYYDNDAIREKYTEPMNRWGGQKLKADGESMWDNGVGQKTYRERDMRPNELGRNKRSVWVVNTKPFKKAHFAVFPEKLIEPCILAGCPEGGVVLDPFIGSGTTGVVARKNHRNYVGIELNKKYIDGIIQERINSVQPVLKMMLY